MESSLPVGPLNPALRDTPGLIAGHLEESGEIIRHLYIHLPFCEKICPYCDFSTALGAGGDMGGFLHALQREGELLREAGILPLVESEGGTLYLGGGTPSLFEPGVLSQILEWIASSVGAGWNEATFEMNPEHADGERLHTLVRGGITRLSLGFQSIDPRVLRTLGRVHSSEQAGEAVIAAKNEGFDISVDLIFAVPGQDHDTWCADLEKVVSLEPHHISLYNLTFEEGTPFSRWLDSGRLTAHDEDWQTEAYQQAVERLRGAGYERYEISNFALPGHASLHNRAYWDREAYLGMGPSAHSLFGRIRTTNHFDLDEWSGALTGDGVIPWGGVEELADLDLTRERVMLGLRTMEGLDLEAVPLRFREDLNNRAREPVALGLASWSGSKLVLTDTGILLADELVAIISP